MVKWKHPIYDEPVYHKMWETPQARDYAFLNRYLNKFADIKISYEPHSMEIFQLLPLFYAMANHGMRIVVKDLSRFGRNYTLTGYYTDIYLLERGVRFVSINDMFDNMNDDNSLSGMYNVMNEFYPRTISKNVRQVVAAGASEGKFMNSHPPYGYVKSPEDKHILIPDKIAAPNVQKIFELYAAGNTGSMIAQILTDEGILSPRAYYYDSIGKKNPKNETKAWGSNTVIQMLKNETYIGNLIQCKRRVLSFKTKKRVANDPSEWIRVNNTHEPIIDKELWDAVQGILSSNTNVRRPKKRELAIFSGMVFCEDCGSSMAATERGSTKKHVTYRCGRYTVYGKKVCTSHNIREELIQEAVISDIRKYAKIAEGDLASLTSFVLKSMNDGAASKLESAAMQLERVNVRMEEIDELVKSLYTDKVRGDIPAQMANKMLFDFENELQELEKQRNSLQEASREEQDQQSQIERWTALIQKHACVEKITRQIAVELIESITISAYYYEDGQKAQDITIKYRFVGNLNGTEEKDESVA